MMKTLKFIVLLTVMLVNVTPYIKDGKVEWKATQAAAQYYTIEDTGMGIWICGSEDDPFITLISRIDCYDLLPSQVSDEEAEFEDCFCEYCGIQKEYCQEPCLICGSTATVDDEGNVYPGTENNTEPDQITPMSSTTYPIIAENIPPGKATWIATLSQENIGVLPENPCEIGLKLTSYKKADGTIDSTTTCLFYVVEALTGKEASVEAALHPNGIINDYNISFISVH